MVFAYAAVAALSIFGYFLLIPSFGMFGAALTTILSEALIGLISFAVILKTTNSRPKLIVFGKAALASALMALALTLLPSIPVLIVTFLGALIYLILILALRAVSWPTLISSFKN